MAFLFRRGNRQYENKVKQRKRELLSGISGTVLEIGPGAGANLHYLPRDIRYFCVEPNPLMVETLRKTAAGLDFQIEVLPGTAARIEMGDASVDFVICTLVLCSVPSVEAVLAEVRRILRPGGIFIFIEHVAAPRGTLLRFIQGMVAPLWRRMNDGCRPNQETWSLLENAGFANVKLEHFRTRFPIVSPHVGGVAANPGAPDSGEVPAG